MTLGQAHLSHLELFDDVKIIEEIDSGFHIGIITNGAGDEHPGSQRSRVDHLNLNQRTDSLWISDDVGFMKPHPAIFKKACKAAGVSEQDSLFVGDSIANDIVGANGAGMVSVFLDRLSRSGTFNDADERPDYTIATLLELPSILGEV